MAQLNEQFLRMQKLAGIITEEQYSEKINEVSISGTLSKIKDKILNLPVFGKLIDAIVSKMSKEDIEKFKAKFNLNEAEGGPSLEDIFAKVNSANPDKDVKEPENLKEELDPDSFQGKVVNLIRNLTGLNLLALGGAPLGMLIASVLGFSGLGLIAGALISLVATLIIHGISRKLLGMGSDDALVGEGQLNEEYEFDPASYFSAMDSDDPKAKTFIQNIKSAADSDLSKRYSIVNKLKDYIKTNPEVKDKLDVAIEFINS